MPSSASYRAYLPPDLLREAQEVDAMVRDTMRHVQTSLRDARSPDVSTGSAGRGYGHNTSDRDLDVRRDPQRAPASRHPDERRPPSSQKGRAVQDVPPRSPRAAQIQPQQQQYPRRQQYAAQTTQWQEGSSRGTSRLKDQRPVMNSSTEDGQGSGVGGRARLPRPAPQLSPSKDPRKTQKPTASVQPPASSQRESQRQQPSQRQQSQSQGHQGQRGRDGRAEERRGSAVSRYSRRADYDDRSPQVSADSVGPQRHRDRAAVPSSDRYEPMPEQRSYSRGTKASVRPPDVSHPQRTTRDLAHPRGSTRSAHDHSGEEYGTHAPRTPSRAHRSQCSDEPSGLSEDISFQQQRHHQEEGRRYDRAEGRGGSNPDPHRQRRDEQGQYDEPSREDVLRLYNDDSNDAPAAVAAAYRGEERGRATARGYDQERSERDGGHRAPQSGDHHVVRPLRTKAAPEPSASDILDDDDEYAEYYQQDDYQDDAQGGVEKPPPAYRGDGSSMPSSRAVDPVVSSGMRSVQQRTQRPSTDRPPKERTPVSSSRTSSVSGTTGTTAASGAASWRDRLKGMKATVPPQQQIPASASTRPAGVGAIETNAAQRQPVPAVSQQPTRVELQRGVGSVGAPFPDVAYDAAQPIVQHGAHHGGGGSGDSGDLDLSDAAMEAQLRDVATVTAERHRSTTQAQAPTTTRTNAAADVEVDAFEVEPAPRTQELPSTATLASSKAASNVTSPNQSRDLNTFNGPTATTAITATTTPTTSTTAAAAATAVATAARPKQDPVAVGASGSSREPKASQQQQMSVAPATVGQVPAMGIATALPVDVIAAAPVAPSPALQTLSQMPGAVPQSVAVPTPVTQQLVQQVPPHRQHGAAQQRPPPAQQPAALQQHPEAQQHFDHHEAALEAQWKQGRSPSAVANVGADVELARRLQEQLETAAERISELESELREAKRSHFEEQQTFHQSMARADDAVATARRETTELKTKLSDEMLERRKGDVEVEAARDELKKWRELSEDQTARIAEAEEKLQRQLDMKGLQEREAAESRAAMLEQIQNAAAADEKSMRLEAQLAEKISDVETLRRERSELEVQLQERSDAIVAARQDAEQFCAVADERRQTLEEKLLERKEQGRRYKGEIARLRAEIDKLEASNAAEMRKAQQTAEELRDQAAKSELRATAAEAREMALEGSLRDRDEKSEARLADKIAEHQSALDDAAAKHAALLEAHMEMQAKVRSMEHQAEKEHLKDDFFARRLAELERDAEKSRALEADAKRELESVKDDLRRRDDRADADAEATAALRRQISDKIEAEQSLIEENGRLRDALQTLRSASAAMEEELSIVQQQSLPASRRSYSAAGSTFSTQPTSSGVTNPTHAAAGGGHNRPSQSPSHSVPYGTPTSKERHQHLPPTPHTTERTPRHTHSAALPSPSPRPTKAATLAPAGPGGSTSRSTSRSASHESAAVPKVARSTPPRRPKTQSDPKDQRQAERRVDAGDVDRPRGVPSLSPFRRPSPAERDAPHNTSFGSVTSKSSGVGSASYRKGTVASDAKSKKHRTPTSTSSAIPAAVYAAESLTSVVGPSSSSAMGTSGAATLASSSVPSMAPGNTGGVRGSRAAEFAAASRHDDDRNRHIASSSSSSTMPQPELRHPVPTAAPTAVGTSAFGLHSIADTSDESADDAHSPFRDLGRRSAPHAAEVPAQAAPSSSARSRYGAAASSTAAESESTATAATTTATRDTVSSSHHHHPASASSIENSAHVSSIRPTSDLPSSAPSKDPRDSTLPPLPLHRDPAFHHSKQEHSSQRSHQAATTSAKAREAKTSAGETRSGSVQSRPRDAGEDDVSQPRRGGAVAATPRAVEAPTAAAAAGHSGQARVDALLSRFASTLDTMEPTMTMGYQAPSTDGPKVSATAQKDVHDHHQLPSSSGPTAARRGSAGSRQVGDTSSASDDDVGSARAWRRAEYAWRRRGGEAEDRDASAM